MQDQIIQAFVDHAAKYYHCWKEASDERVALVAFDYKARYEAIAELAKDICGITKEQFEKMILSSGK